MLKDKILCVSFDSECREMKNIGKLSDFIAVYIRLLASVDAFLFSIIPLFLRVLDVVWPAMICFHSLCALLSYQVFDRINIHTFATFEIGWMFQCAGRRHERKLTSDGESRYYVCMWREWYILLWRGHMSLLAFWSIRIIVMIMWVRSTSTVLISPPLVPHSVQSIPLVIIL